MKNFKYLFIGIFVSLGIWSCEKQNFDDTGFINSATTPANLSVMYDITQDNSGLVTITPNGENGVYYDVYFGDTTQTPAKVNAGFNVQHRYAEGVYNVKIVSHGITGKTAEFTKELTVSFRAPENLLVNTSIDASNVFKLNVTASALYETVFKVYFGETVNEIPVSFLEGETASHVYGATGIYTVRVVALSGGAATTEVTRTISIVNPVTLPINFESSTINYAFNNFDGGNASVISNPQQSGINTSSKTGRMIKNSGQTWGGSWIGLGAPIDFSVNKYFRMKVFSPRVGAKVLLKVENASNGAINFEKEVLTTTANTWETLVFDYNAINASEAYHNIVLIFDNGIMGDGSANFTWLFDDINLSNISPLTQINLPVTFELTTMNYAVSDFGNNQTIDAPDPVNAANHVKKTTKPNGAETWAGTTMGTGGTGFANPIPFAAGSTLMSVKVYSPAAGIPVRLKTEDHSNPSRSVETQVLTTVANAWETLVFDFSNHASGTQAINFSYTYDMASIFFDFGTAGNGKVFYWDDVSFGAPAAAIGLPLDFQSATATYTFNDFDGGNATVINNTQPGGINTSSKVGRMIKNAGQTWGGSWIALSSPINFTGTSRIFHMKVFSPRVGAKVLLKVENMTNGAISFEREVLTTTANAWEDLTFDYTAINTANSYQKIVLIFDNGIMGDGSANFTWLFDDITLN